MKCQFVANFYSYRKKTDGSKVIDESFTESESGGLFVDLFWTHQFILYIHVSIKSRQDSGLFALMRCKFDHS